jgi:ERCC4-related helicase
MKNRVKMWKEKKVTFATPQEEQASEPSSGSDDTTDKEVLSIF